MEKKVYAYCLKGDVQGAYNYLKQAEKDKDMEELYHRYTERFFQEKPEYPYKTSDPWIRKILKAYYDYFVKVLTSKDSETLAENTLLFVLSGLLEGGPFTHLDEVESALEKRFREKGYYFLGGITAPYRGPYIWSKQEQKDYEVSLPSGIQKVTVYFMDDFILHSWLHFATFGEMAVGGWAKSDALYCVKNRYEALMDQPAFLVSYLKHEAQHFSDYQNFPMLGPCDLEYRAKLVELMYYPSASLLEAFAQQADPAPSNPHAYASFVLCSRLSYMLFNHNGMDERIDWRQIEKERVQTAAGELFSQNTEQLIKEGKETVEGVI